MYILDSCVNDTILVFDKEMISITLFVAYSNIYYKYLDNNTVVLYNFKNTSLVEQRKLQVDKLLGFKIIKWQISKTDLYANDKVDFFVIADVVQLWRFDFVTNKLIFKISDLKVYYTW